MTARGVSLAVALLAAASPAATVTLSAEDVDAIGRVVEVRKSQGTTIRMDIGDLASGYYAVQLLFSGELLGSAVVVKL